MNNIYGQQKDGNYKKNGMETRKIKTTATEMKNAFHRFHGRLDRARKRIHGIGINTNYPNWKTEIKEWKKKEHPGVAHNIEHCNIRVIRSSESEGKENGAEKVNR